MDNNSVRLAKMKIAHVLLCLALPTISVKASSDIFFLRAEAGATVSFEGFTQAGIDIHRFKVRRIGYVDPNTKEELASTRCCVIYFAGIDFGPSVLKEIQAINPSVRRVGRDLVEVYFFAGGHAHIRQTWRLLGSTAKLEKEEDISDTDDPPPTSKSTQRPGGSRQER